MKIKAIAPWFGSKRTLAPTIVEELGEHVSYYEAFCGSMAVLLAKPPASQELAIELHGDLTNLAFVLQDRQLAEELYDRLGRTLYADGIFDQSRAVIVEPWPGGEPSVDRALHYFIASWMGRNGVSGTQRVNYQQAMRWTPNGGAGPIRFRSAVDSIPDWHERLRNVAITRMDSFIALEKIDDHPRTAIYADPPYFHDGVNRSGSSKYEHDFEAPDHERLAKLLGRFKRARVVVSYYDHPELDRLYAGWTKRLVYRQKNLHVQNRRGAGKIEAPEVLLLNGPSYAKAECGQASLF